MALEVERKFLVKNEDFKRLAIKSYKIAQGYLSSVPERTVRVRLTDEKGFLTIKGGSDSEGITRFEWEKEIESDEAKELLRLCEPGVIIKSRYLVSVGTHVFEVDVFEGENKGLIVAEIELNSEDELFEKPDWLGKEVTGEEKYYNASLSRYPYKDWK